MHADRAVIHADGRGAPEEPLHIRRPRGRGEIEVRMEIVEQGVAQRAAHAPRLEPGLLEHASDLEDLGRHGHALGGTHADPYGTPADSAMVSSIRACEGVRGPAGSAPMAVVRAPPPSKA